MGKRFIIAILTILISGLKFMENMISVGISFITKKDIPLVGMEALHNTSIPLDDDSEEQESLKRSIYVVEHNEYGTQVEMSEYNPKIKDIQSNISRDLLD